MIPLGELGTMDNRSDKKARAGHLNLLAKADQDVVEQFDLLFVKQGSSRHEEIGHARQNLSAPSEIRKAGQFLNQALCRHIETYRLPDLVRPPIVAAGQANKNAQTGYSPTAAHRRSPVPIFFLIIFYGIASHGYRTVKIDFMGSMTAR